MLALNFMLSTLRAARGWRTAWRVGGALLAGLAAGPAFGQADSLGGITGKLTRYERRGPQEKLFLHLDRPLYLSGEVMWFKVYAVDAATSKPLALSSVAYVEVLDARRRPVLQGKVALQQATGHGSFELPAGLASGSYTVRAYTSWMKNFGPETFFHSAVTVVNTAVASGAVKADSVAYDAQFFPEGGHLVQGLRSKVAFKVTDQTGRSVAAEGQVLNQRGAVVASFRAERLGMGSFLLTPAAGAGSPEAYTAVLKLPKGQVLRRKLPPVQTQGYVLGLEPTVPDQLTLTVMSTAPQPQTVYLLAHAHQKAAVATTLQVVNGRAVVLLKPDQLPEGVSHFTLFDAAQQPLCERLYFRRPRAEAALSVQLDKASYQTREAVRLQVAAPSQPAAASASLSMAVYRLDSLNKTAPVSIGRYLALASELRGNVENPDYYFTAAAAEAAAAADNLMLTQGWSRFQWDDVLAPASKPLAFLPEPNGHVIRGQLTQPGTGKPRIGIPVYLSTPSRITRLQNSLSRPDGQVQFEMPRFYGPQELVLQTDAQLDTTSVLKLYNPFSERFAPLTTPSFQVQTSLQQDYTKRHLQAQVQHSFYGNLANRFVRPRPDTLAFYGRPDEVYLLDKYTRFPVLEEVLREYVPGVIVRIRKGDFHFQVVDKLNKSVFENNPLVLLDGVPVFNLNKMMKMNPLKIKKLEVVDSRYFHGPTAYEGIVSFTTYDGDLAGFELDPRVLVERYEGLQLQRQFYAPRYDTPQQKLSRLPDLRNLLYWNPEVRVGGSTPQDLTFYTGDQAGRYLVLVQGLSSAGEPSSQRVLLEVKAPL